jgi:type I restriction enzyme M protein
LDDSRWRGYDVPPKSNANYGWILNKDSLAEIFMQSDNGICFIVGNMNLCHSLWHKFPGVITG